MKLNETDKALYCIAWYNGYAKELKRIHKYLAKCEKEIVQMLLYQDISCNLTVII